MKTHKPIVCLLVNVIPMLRGGGVGLNAPEVKKIKHSLQDN